MQTREAARDFLTYCQAKGHRAKTLEGYQWALERLEAVCQELPATRRELMPALAIPELADASRRSLVGRLKVFFNWAVEELLDASPMKKVKLPGKRSLPRVFTEAEVADIYDACRNQRDLAVITLPLHTGARLKSVAALTWPDIGPDYATLQGKGGHTYRVPLAPEVKRLLLGLGEGDYIFTGRHGGPITYNGMKTVYREIFHRAGLSGPKLGPHTLRHTFGTQYIRAGGNVRILQEIMNHEDLATTMLYVHLAGRDVADDHARANPIASMNLERFITRKFA
jgi:integrase